MERWDELVAYSYLNTSDTTYSLPVPTYIFLTSIPVTADHNLDISSDSLLSEFPDKSNQPSLSVSPLAYTFLNNYVDTATPDYSGVEGTIIYPILSSGIGANNHQVIYILMQAIGLESMALTYAYTYDHSLYEEISTRDIKRTRKNIRLLCDWLGSDSSYQYLVEWFRNVELSLGYLENQIDLLVNGLSIRTDDGSEY